ncbi:MAG: hypothetical protein IPP41_09665 [Rhodocyclaceae bacterium]|nr:hypothetical protein [Rhodocyclaceae bacterium]
MIDGVTGNKTLAQSLATGRKDNRSLVGLPRVSQTHYQAPLAAAWD